MTAAADIWRCDGTYNSDYGKGATDGFAGTKAELLAKRWKEHWPNDPTPPPDPTAPKNYDVNVDPKRKSNRD